MPKPKSKYKQALRAFSPADLKRVCEMHEDDFFRDYDMESYKVPQRAPHDWYYYKDNGADILAVAHLDTVMPHNRRGCNYINTAAGTVIYSGALDDRLGAYTILELMPKLDINFDILLTVGEESGASTASYFEVEKEYNWMIEFDRGGTDVVTYQYEDLMTSELVRASGARLGNGIFSDISYMEHLEIKGFNWGVGYRDYHGPRSHAFLEDYLGMMGHYLRFHEANADTYLPHEKELSMWTSLGNRGTWRDGPLGVGGVDYEADGDGEFGNGNWWDDDEPAWIGADPSPEEIQAILDAEDEKDMTKALALVEDDDVAV